MMRVKLQSTRRISFSPHPGLLEWNRKPYCTRELCSPDQLGPDVPGDQGAGGEQGAVRAAHHRRRDDADPDPGDGRRRQVLENQPMRTESFDP